MNDECVFCFLDTYWVPQNSLQIYTVITYICIGKVAWFAVISEAPSTYPISRKHIHFIISSSLINRNLLFLLSKKFWPILYSRLHICSVKISSTYSSKVLFNIYKMTVTAHFIQLICTVCPRSLDPIYIVTYYIKCFSYTGCFSLICALWQTFATSILY